MLPCDLQEPYTRSSGYVGDGVAGDWRRDTGMEVESELLLPKVMLAIQTCGAGEVASEVVSVPGV